MTLTIIPVPSPDSQPLRGVDAGGVHWAAEDSAAAPFALAHAHTEHGAVQFTDIKFAGSPLSDLTLVPFLPWDALIAGVVAHFSNGWEALLLVTVDGDGAVQAVSIPTAVLFEDLDGVPATFPGLLSERLNDLYLAGQLDAVEDNLDRVLDIALPPDTSAREADQTGDAPDLEPDSAPPAGPETD